MSITILITTIIFSHTWENDLTFLSLSFFTLKGNNKIYSLK